MPAQIHYEILGMRFAAFGKDGEGVAQFVGRVRMPGYESRFEMMLAPSSDGRWHGRSINWEKPARPVLNGRDFLQQLVDRCAKFLNTMNMWPTSQGEAGAKLSLNMKVIPPEYDDRVIVSVRPDMLGLPSSVWHHLWDLIGRRLNHDPYFKVLGFEHDVVKAVLPRLKPIFTADWVKARYRRAGLKNMTGQMEPEDEGFFPAYHLARTAHGLICRDPGWNYLVEIGLALQELEGVEGFSKLVQRLANSPGFQHHVCLAAELHKRGFLIGLEPPTGVGSASSDLLVEVGGQPYQIEVKEFSSRNPLNQLRKELADKAKKLPAKPAAPVVFHVVFRETGVQDVQVERKFFETIAEIAEEIPPKISAVVAGRRFVDSLGGPVKRDWETMLINEQATISSDEGHLRELFHRNYEEAHMPYYGLASLFVFGQKRETPQADAGGE